MTSPDPTGNSSLPSGEPEPSVAGRQFLPHVARRPNSIPAPFYITGGTLAANASSYIVRHADTELVERLRRVEFCYVFNTRQMGKSSLMIRAATRLHREGAAVAVLDLNAVGQNLTASRWYFGLLSRIAEQLELEEELERFWQEQAQLGPMQRFISSIGRIVLPAIVRRRQSQAADEAQRRAAEQTPLVIFIDEIDAVRILPFSTDEFFAGIRECYNRRAWDPEFSRVTFCLLGVATPSDLIADPRISPFNIGQGIALSDFTAEEAAPLAEGLRRLWASRGGAEEAEAALDRILYWTGGHPYLTQRLCRALTEATEEPHALIAPRRGGGRSPIALVDQACNRLFLNRVARDTDDNLGFVRDRLLRDETDPAALLSLYLRVWKGDPVPDDETNPLCTVLRLSGIARVADGCLTVRNRIYGRVFDRAWVYQNMPGAEQRRQRAAYWKGVLRTAAVAGMIFSGMAAWIHSQIRQKMRFEENMETARRAVEMAAQKAALADQSQYQAAMEQAASCWQSGDTARLSQRLTQTQDNPERSFEWYYWQQRLHPEIALCDTTVGPVGFTPQGRPVQAGVLYNEAGLWDAATGEKLLSLPGAAPPFLLSPDGRHILTGAPEVPRSPEGRYLRPPPAQVETLLWDAQTGRLLADWKDILPIAFTADSRCFQAIRAVGYFRPELMLFPGEFAPLQDHEIGLYDADTGRRLDPIGFVSRTLNSPIACSPDGRSIATGDIHGSLYMHDAATGRKLLSFPTPLSPVGELAAIAYGRDGRRLITGGLDGRIRIWDVAARRQVAMMQSALPGVRVVALSADGAKAAAGAEDGAACIWDARTGALLLRLITHGHGIRHITFSADGEHLITADGAPFKRSELNVEDAFVPSEAGYGVAEVWDARQDGAAITLPEARALAFSADGARLITLAREGRVEIREAAAGRLCATLKGAVGSIDTAAFSPDGASLVTGDDEGRACQWDARTGQRLRILMQSRYPVGAVAFSPNGKWIAAGVSGPRLEPGEKQGRIWEAATGRQIAAFVNSEGRISSLTFSPDGKRLLIGSGGLARIRDVATGRELIAMGAMRSDLGMADWSRDGSRIVTAAGNDAISIWMADNRHCLLTIRGNRQGIVTARFTPDGKRILTSGSDGTVRLWHAETGSEMLAFPNSSAPLMSPDGERLAMSTPGGIRVYRIQRPDRVAYRESIEKAIQTHLAMQGMPADPTRPTDIFSVTLATASIHPPAAAFIRDWLALTPLQGENGDYPIGPPDINLQTLRPRAGEKIGAQPFGPWIWQPRHLVSPVLEFDQRWLLMTPQGLPPQKGRPGLRFTPRIMSVQPENYAVCYLVSDRDQHGVDLEIASSGPITAYLNGAPDYFEFLAPHHMMQLATLRKGVNVLALKGASNACYVSLLDRQGQPVPGLHISLQPGSKEAPMQ
jgi:WD40 repeat protein